MPTQTINGSSYFVSDENLVFAATLRRERILLGFSQHELAATLGVRGHLVRRWEEGFGMHPRNRERLVAAIPNLARLLRPRWVRRVRTETINAVIETETITPTGGMPRILFRLHAGVGTMSDLLDYLGAAAAEGLSLRDIVSFLSSIAHPASTDGMVRGLTRLVAGEATLGDVLPYLRAADDEGFPIDDCIAFLRHFSSGSAAE